MVAAAGVIWRYIWKWSAKQKISINTFHAKNQTIDLEGLQNRAEDETEGLKKGSSYTVILFFLFLFLLLYVPENVLG